jgi:hypothetical protein
MPRPGVSDAICLSPSRQLCQAHCNGTQQGRATRTRAQVGAKDGHGGGLLILLVEVVRSGMVTRQDKNRVAGCFFLVFGA